MKNIDCPSCGAEIPLKLKFAKVLICEYCQSTLFVEDESVRNAGKMSSLTDVPSILKPGKNYVYRNWSFQTIGRVRYDYGRGFWDEWFVVDDKDEYKWISVDEGDIAIEEKICVENEIPSWETAVLGTKLELKIKNFPIQTVISEKNHCKCIGAEGQLPFKVSLEESYNYLDLSAPNSGIYTIEYTEDGIQIFRGKWVDPFDVKEV